ncbi:MAG: GyrI-like domain-containing protein [Methanomicrobiales archaeon]|nr:GyrI-like domain-containing protein [Methanomicrobiales archaeon]
MPARDRRKEFNRLYQSSEETVDVVDVPAMNFLMTDGPGEGDPYQDFRDSIEALYTVTYALKIVIGKSVMGFEYSVMPLESLRWTGDSGSPAEESGTRLWRLMIVQPEYVGPDLFDEVMKKVGNKISPRKVTEIRFERFTEGLSAQTLHVGPYSEETDSLIRLHQVIQEKGYRMRGKHHEIYLSDPGRVLPSQLRTILRQPIE